MLNADDTQALRDDLEVELDRVLSRALRRFLARLQQAATAALPEALTAAAVPLEGPSMGDAYGWWGEAVEDVVLEDLRATMTRAYAEMTEAGAVLESATSQHVPEYLGRVKDRLVRGIQPPLPEQAFNLTRGAVNRGLAEGWSRPQMAQRIAAELSWETDEPYWRRERERYTTELEGRLNRYGPKGTPAREQARLGGDPEVARLQAARTEAVKRLEGSESYWQTRATRIARTEATGALAYAALQALADEGFAEKVWVSAHDSRTRDSHVAADGQQVTLATPFNVGGYRLMMPGDPGAPAGEVINCRCTIIGADPDVEETPLEDLSMDDLEAAMEQAMAEERWDDVDRYGAAMDARENAPAPTPAFTPTDYQRFEDADEAEQFRMMDQITESGGDVDTWLREQYAYAQDLTEGQRAYQEQQAGPTRAEVAAAWDDWVDNELRRMEAVTNGNLLTREAQAKGVNPRDLWRVNATTAAAWASEEVLREWDRVGRMNREQFEAGYRGQSADGQRHYWA